jgi:hypothetical protein
MSPLLRPPRRLPLLANTDSQDRHQESPQPTASDRLLNGGVAVSIRRDEMGPRTLTIETPYSVLDDLHERLERPL